MCSNGCDYVLLCCVQFAGRLVAERLSVELQTTYNVTAMSFTPAELCAAIQRRLPRFHVDYRPDFRDLIARSWPQSVDDSAARRDWGWQPSFDLDVRPSLPSLNMTNWVTACTAGTSLQVLPVVRMNHHPEVWRALFCASCPYRLFRTAIPSFRNANSRNGVFC